MHTTLLIMMFGIGIISFSALAQADSSFEIVDLSGDVIGEPQFGSDAARSSWMKSCEAWKKETKELNRNNEMLQISCSTPSCGLSENGKTLCTSSGDYKIKTAGTRIANQSQPQGSVAPQAFPVYQDSPTIVVQRPVVVAESPPIYVEPVPVWAPFWMWRHHHHYHHYRSHWR